MRRRRGSRRAWRCCRAACVAANSRTRKPRLPSVATPLPEIRRFADEHPEVVTFANDAPDFVAALRAAAAKNGPAAEMRRMRIARRYDWSAQMALMNELMERALDDVGRASAR